MTPTRTSPAPRALAQDAPAPSSPLGARLVPAVAAVLVLLLLALLFWGISRPTDSAGLALVHARDVPDLTLHMLDGERVQLSDLRGRPALLNFWASWCVPCEVEAPALEAAARQYGQRVAFVGINVQDAEADARRFVERFAVTYPTARDASGEVSIAFGMTGVPETYVLDADGRIVSKWNGPLTVEGVDRLLSPLLDQ